MIPHGRTQPVADEMNDDDEHFLKMSLHVFTQTPCDTSSYYPLSTSYYTVKVLITQFLAPITYELPNSSCRTVIVTHPSIMFT